MGSARRIPTVGETVTLRSWPQLTNRFTVVDHDGIDMANRPMLIAEPADDDARTFMADRHPACRQLWFSAGQTVEYEP